MTARRYRHRTVHVDADVVIGEVLSEITDDELMEEVRHRLILPPPPPPRPSSDGIDEEFRRAFRERDATHFEVLLTRHVEQPIQMLPAKAFRS